MSEFPWITALTLTPLLGSILVAGLGSQKKQPARVLGFLFSLIALAVTFCIWKNFERGSAELQFVERHDWIPSLRIEYFVGLDGLGLAMLLLSALVVPFAMLVSTEVVENTKIYYSLLLLLEAGLFGAFTALNFFHWFFFWELTLVPAFFLIRLWGGPERTRAATQFFVYTMVGSIALLLSFLAIFLATQGTPIADKFDFMQLADLGQTGQLASALSVRLGWYELFPTEQSLALFIFLGALLGFAVKVPLFPFHTWLPLAYAEAPTGVTMILTGAMSKMGVYGFLRILMPIFPEQMRQVLTPLLWLAVATVVLAAFAALAQSDLKRMLAYSSINHLGYCLLGIFAALQSTGTEPRWAFEKTSVLNGVVLQMFNHGLTASALFCFVGYLERRTGGLRGLEHFGGLRKVAPVFCGLMGIALFASLGLPGLNGFVGEFLIFKGTFPLVPWAAALSTLGLLVTAVFILTILQRVFSGPLNERWASFADLTWTERVTVLPAIALMFVVGIYPQLLIGVTNSLALQLTERLKF